MPSFTQKVSSSLLFRRKIPYEYLIYYLTRVERVSLYIFIVFTRVLGIRCEEKLSKTKTIKIFYLFSFVETPFYLFSFVETPLKFTIAKLSIRKLTFSSVLIILLPALMKFQAYGSKALRF